MFIFVLPLSLFLFATSKSGILENQSSVLLGSVYCVHVKNLSDSLKSLYLRSSGGDKKGRGKHGGLKMMWTMRERSFWHSSISCNPSLWFRYTLIVYKVYNLTSMFLRHKIISFHQHTTVFLSAAEICLWSIDHSKHRTSYHVTNAWLGNVIIYISIEMVLYI